ncbi:MAG: NAD(P)H-dependent oxidoreductase [Bacteroidales bacterium]|nr:NAD(P)H-dependent oxidoreductase [Bacteroidales bacterium]MDD3431385.1 NAD(P)H-dependent oxidoreductase [Bacteroidales bacterium]MDD4362145.1 NAD(P)H-dependent oxidoreductase [Bacteroidales bacterium]MDD4430640.1 NAD(P)H-dependent oxidoreductase [Bacteroidales bacterium]
MNILAFGASYSSTSINRRFAIYTTQLFEQNNSVEILDLRDFDLPLFTVDLEASLGHPAIINRFLEKLEWADFIIISMSEHNGSFNAAFKNLMDWTSRVKRDMFNNKPVLLLSTSPSPRGGAGSLQAGQDLIGRFSAKVIDRFSLPQFAKNFNETDGITEPEYLAEYRQVIQAVKKELDLI